MKRIDDPGELFWNTFCIHVRCSASFEQNTEAHVPDSPRAPYIQSRCLRILLNVVECFYNCRCLRARIVVILQQSHTLPCESGRTAMLIYGLYARSFSRASDATPSFECTHQNRLYGPYRLIHTFLLSFVAA